MRAAALVGLAVTVGSVLLAQQPRQTSPTFRSGIDIVRVDVSVLDAQRHPIRGLTPDDFTVKVNGQPQKVVALSEIDVAPPVAPAAGWLSDVTPDVATNRVRDRRVWAIVMDDATASSDVWVVNNARSIARAIVNRMGVGDVAAVIFTRDNRGSQEFTADRNKLLTAIETFSPSADPAVSDVGITQRAPSVFDAYALNALGATATALSELADRRKVLVYVGRGVNVSVEQLAPVLATLDGGAVDRLNESDIFRSAAGVLRFASANNVNVYPFDPEGLRPAAKGGLTGNTDFLRALATNSGGRAAVNTNDALPAVEQMFVENQSYYLLGYQVPTSERHERSRLEITVNRPGARVRSLQQVVPIVARESSRTSAVASALGSVLPVSNVPMTAAAAPFQKKGSDATVAVTVGVYGTVGDRARDTVDLIVTAFDSDGKQRKSERTTVEIGFRSGAGAATMTMFEVQSRIEVKPGRYQLRIAAHRGNSDDSGSVFSDIEVPNFEKDDVSLSGVALSVLPGPVFAPRGALSDLIPVVPTTLRDFSRGAAVEAFARIYQGGRRPVQPVLLSVKFVDTNNVTVMSRKEPIPESQFLASRASDYRLPLPTSALTPGAYLMRLEATVGTHTAVRDVMFVVR